MSVRTCERERQKALSRDRWREEERERACSSLIQMEGEKEGGRERKAGRRREGGREGEGGRKREGAHFPHMSSILSAGSFDGSALRALRT